MISFKKIWIVARFEIKTLWRSWFFRIFAGISVFFLALTNIGLLAVFGDGAPWAFRGISSSVPYFNIMFLNIVQAIIAVFLASDFLKRDKKLDTTEVIYIRSMSNGEYVLGKTFGITFIFLLLNIVILMIAFILNLVIKDVGVNYTAYLLYPLLVSLPTLIFIFGLSFLFMSLIRNQAVTFVLLLGYIGVSLFVIGEKYNYVFDYIAFYLPLVYSDFIGFGNLSEILIQRGIYLFLGLGFIFMTVLLLRRLPQSKTMTWFSILASIVFVGGGLTLATIHIINHSEKEESRQEMLSISKNYDEKALVSITNYDIDIQHKKTIIESTAKLVFQNNNNEAIEQYIFNLNPGLKVENIKIDGRDINFTRESHILIVKAPTALLPGSSGSLSITYKGSIDENACYLDIMKEDMESRYNIAGNLFNVDRRFAIINEDFVLLTPETSWYPTPGAWYSPDYPAKHIMNFANYKVKIRTRKDLTAISQGPKITGQDGNYIFEPETKLSQISIVIGEYEEKSIKVDSISYYLYYLEGHDYFKSYLNELQDTLPILIREMKNDYERNLNLRYMFPRLSIVEVPIQFTTFRRLWTNSFETVQPEMVLLPEKCINLNIGDFKQTKTNIERGIKRSNQAMSDKEIQASIFIRFVSSVFTRGSQDVRFRGNRDGSMSIVRPEDRYMIYPNYYYYVNFLKSDQWPIINIALESFMTQGAGSSGSTFGRGMTGISEDEKANLALDGTSLNDLLKKSTEDPIIYDVIKSKGNYMFTLLQGQAGIDEFEEFIHGEVLNNKFRVLDIDNLNESVKNKFGFEFYPYLEEIYNSKQLPGFIIDDFKSYEIVVDNRTRYQMRFFLSNPEPASGSITLSFRSGGGRGGMGGGRGGSSGTRVVQIQPGSSGNMRNFMMGANTQDIERIIYFEPNQTLEIGIVLDDQPRMMIVNTLISKNIPNTITSTISNLELDRFAEPFTGEVIVEDYKGSTSPDEIIVDNEDPGFETHIEITESFLKKLLNITNENDEKYPGISIWRPPVEWQATTNSFFYGKYIKSAHYTKAGGGQNKVSWTANIPESGNYDVYTYIEPRITRMGRGMGRGGGGDRNSNTREGSTGGPGQSDDQFHYKIFHDDGIEDVILDVTNAEQGWNFMGTFYISPGSARVELSNESKGKIVAADAIKWTRR